jgi:hypothetical protein
LKNIKGTNKGKGERILFLNIEVVRRAFYLVTAWLFPHSNTPSVQLPRLISMIEIRYFVPLEQS